MIISPERIPWTKPPAYPIPVSGVGEGRAVRTGCGWIPGRDAHNWRTMELIFPLVGKLPDIQLCGK